MSSSKRTADRELNHDNWNEEEEGEDAGEFKKASETELQKRVRKVAKRRITPGESENAPNANPFAGFGGFNSNASITTSTPAPNVSPFGFLAKIASQPIIPKTNGSTEATKEKSNTEYLRKIKALNIAVADWIKSNVDENPLCIITPIFRDYENYIKKFEDLKNKPQESKEAEPKEPAPSYSFGKPLAPTSSPPVSSAPSTSVFNSFKFGDSQKSSALSPPKPAEPPAKESQKFSFGLGLSGFGAQPSAVSSTFSFGLQNPLASSTFGGLSSTSTPFSFSSSVVPAKSDATEKTGEDADEEPPKNDFVPVVEDDSLYQKRCKVFVKTGADYADRGVGTLYIKKVEDSKIQMIVRADTNLGNILLNIMLIEGLPTSRLGKNNVMVVCVPTPDAKPPPVSVLLRVKTGDEADELLKTIEQHKK